MFRVKYPSVIRKNKGIYFRAIIFFLLMIQGCFLVGCDDDKDSIERNDHEYYPLRKGWFQVYQVDEIVYQLGVPETLRYQLKTIVADSFPNPEGSFTYVIHRSRKFEGNASWVAAGTWSARITDREVIVTEGSTPYVVISFPAQTGTKWNGNAYNDEINPNTNTGLDEYEIESVSADCELNGLVFDDCLSVVQESNEEFIVYYDKRRETYARNVGLISREATQLRYCNNVDRDCIGQQIVDEGVIYKQMILEYGLE